MASPRSSSALRGRIFDVAVDVRPNSPTYLQWAALELGLEAGAGEAAYIAPGLAHGFMTLEPDSEIHYLMGAAHSPASSCGLRWDDPAIGIAWPHHPQVISQRDSALPLVDGPSRD